MAVVVVGGEGGHEGGSLLKSKRFGWSVIKLYKCIMGMAVTCNEVKYAVSYSTDRAFCLLSMCCPVNQV